MLFEMNLKVVPPPTVLASPVVSREYIQPKYGPMLLSQHKSRKLSPDHSHETLSLICCIKTCCSETGKNLKNLNVDCNRIFGLPLSRLAPARKSAQIIPKQYPRDLSVANMRPVVSIACSTTGI